MNNNPAGVMWNEARQNGHTKLILVSLGTGIPPGSKVEFYKRGILGFRKQTVTPMQLLKAISWDSETEHHHVLSIAGERFPATGSTLSSYAVPSDLRQTIKKITSSFDMSLTLRMPIEPHTFASTSGWTRRHGVCKAGAT
jgi:hypothetical protein